MTISFDVNEFDSHVEHLGTLSSGVSSLVDTAQTPPNPLMYGIIAGPILIPVMGSINSAGGLFVGGIKNAVSSTQEQMGHVRDAYKDTEESQAERTKAVTDALDGIDVPELS